MMIARSENMAPGQDENWISAAKSTSNLSMPMRAPTKARMLCLLLAISNIQDVLVVGFTTASRAKRKEFSLCLVPTSQNPPILPCNSPPSVLSPTTSQVQRSILCRTEENVILDSKLNSLAPASTTALLAVDSSGKEGLDTKTSMVGTNKYNFFASLDTMETLNEATKERSALLAKMIDEKKIVSIDNREREETMLSSTPIVPTVSYEKPGSIETFLAANTKSPIAVGTWKVVYAPHMTTAMNIFRGRFDVTYDLKPDCRIVSHAYYDFPIFGKGFLSVSGTYGSVESDASNTYSRVDFDKAWIKPLPSSSSPASGPYNSLDAVPDSFLKTIINEIGKRAFIESVAVFPVSFLDDDTIVFEFEFLGTKICAHKV